MGRASYFDLGNDEEHPAEVQEHLSIETNLFVPTAERSYPRP